MDPYIQQLQRDYDAGTLLMECIAPQAYDTLVSAGVFQESDYLMFMTEATIYTQAWKQKNAKTVASMLDNPAYSLGEKALQHWRLRKVTAKKMAVYDHLSKSKELSDGKV